MVVIKLINGQVVSFPIPSFARLEGGELTVLQGVPGDQVVAAVFNWNHVIGYAFEEGVFNGDTDYRPQKGR